MNNKKLSNGASHKTREFLPLMKAVASQAIPGQECEAGRECLGTFPLALRVLLWACLALLPGRRGSHL